MIKLNVINNKQKNRSIKKYKLSATILMKIKNAKKQK